MISRGFLGSLSVYLIQPPKMCAGLYETIAIVGSKQNAPRQPTADLALLLPLVGNRHLQPTQKLKATLANPTIRRFLIHYFELRTFKTYSNARGYCIYEGPKTHKLWLSQFALIVEYHPSSC